MNDVDKKLKEIRSSLEQETRIDLHHHPVEVDCRHNVVTIRGELGTVAAKKLALEYATALADGIAVVDRLKVRPAQAMEDGALCDLVFEALYGETAFNDFILHSKVGGSQKGYRETPRAPTGSIEIDVKDGVVTLTGEVESYAHKALAGVLAWWRRGTCDVVNNLAVEHPMDDTDGEMTDTLRMVLEKDRFLDPAQIRVHCRGFTAILDGLVKNTMEKELAESDAWCVFGVMDVENRLRVRE